MYFDALIYLKCSHIAQLLLHFRYRFSVTDTFPDSGVASYGALGHLPPRLPTISLLVHFGVNLAANYPNIV